MELKKLREKKTSWDFSKNEHRREVFKSSEGNKIIIDHLQKGNSSMGYVRFVNDDYGLSVFGDFGNWIFCRPFVPSEEEYVCVMYWNEKLKISSCQSHSEFDGEETGKEIEELINGGLEEYGYEGDKLKEIKDWYKELLEYTDDEIEYTYQAYRGCYRPDIDYECIPFVKKGSYQLEIVFDAFNEICNRLQDKK